MTSKSVRVVLLGPGLVGRAVCNLLKSSRAIHAQRHGLKFDVVSLIDSSGYLAESKGIADETISSALAWKQSGKRMKDFQGGSAADMKSALSALDIDPSACVVDCTGTDATTPFLVESLGKGAGVVTANKKPMCCPFEMYKKMMETPTKIGFESTVGAGTPVVHTLNHIIASGDKIVKIQGALSGTLGYLMSGLQEGKAYSEVVKEAHKLGFTEPDPRDDLGGMDVARKALILSRLWGSHFEMKDVKVEPLFPERFASLDIPDFMAALPELDEEYAKQVQQAEKDGKALRYVASIDEKSCVVGLKAVEKESPLGRLSGSDNLVEFYTEIYGNKPVVVQGAGAGDAVTAVGIVGDLVRVALAK
ncbi:hypothetical protein AAMO2058_001107100 [Amorphochlora amoebiformis]|uniref:Homoserine dehydrogenase n=2 Tax=Amorphochlora amoebiformis TaxID=1561963 RepID=A0A7S0H0S2_9EUKA|mmetsp:Transcript_24726/g.39027  ORF Transcript_24726/g.39027 Transcript_24726/m.39027 type:complete len:362 (+) Transcript_24726:51-1136(+)